MLLTVRRERCAGAGTTEGGASQVGNQSEHGAEADDGDADPDPGDQGIDEDLDDRPAAGLIESFIGQIKIFFDGRANPGQGLRLHHAARECQREHRYGDHHDARRQDFGDRKEAV